MGTALWDFCSAHYKDELVVCGTKGALSMSIFGKGKWRCTRCVLSLSHW